MPDAPATSTPDQNFTAEPVARVHLPARIPLGLHGSWLPDAWLRAPC